MKNKNTKRYQVILIGIASVVAVFGIVFALTQKTLPSVNQNVTPTIDPNYYDNKEWLMNKTANEEYVGRIHFESGLIDEQVVQTEDNEKYLQLSWNQQPTTHGSVFMDYRNTMDDQNIIFYGHYVYADESLIFGPLHQLIEEKNYAGNKVIQLDLENERKEYEVVTAYYYEMDNPTLEYFHTNYDETYFNLYMEKVKEREFYSTNIELTMDDKLITLQTCVRDRNDLRLIVIAKEVR